MASLTHQYITNCSIMTPDLPWLPRILQYRTHAFPCRRWYQQGRKSYCRSTNFTRRKYYCDVTKLFIVASVTSRSRLITIITVLNTAPTSVFLTMWKNMIIYTVKLSLYFRKYYIRIPFHEAWKIFSARFVIICICIFKCA